MGLAGRGLGLRPRSLLPRSRSSAARSFTRSRRTSCAPLTSLSSRSFAAFSRAWERDVRTAATLDRPRRALADRIRIDEQRDHHARVKRSAPPAIPAVLAIERREVELIDRVQRAHTTRGDPRPASHQTTFARQPPAPTTRSDAHRGI
jgi:hypothetical protein